MSFRCEKTTRLPAAIALLFALSGCGGDGLNIANKVNNGVQLDTTSPPPSGGTLLPPPLPQAGSPLALDSENLGDVESFSAVVDGSGNVTVVWTQWDGMRNNLWVNRYDVSNGWETAGELEVLPGSVSSVQVVVDDAGNVTVVWVQEVEGAYIIPGSSGPSPTPPQLVNVARTDLWAKRYEVGSGWVTEVLLETSDLATDSQLEARDPQAAATENIADIGEVEVVVDDNAIVTVVWSQHDGTRYDLYGVRYVSGAWEATPTLLETENLGNVSSPSIVRNGNNLLVLWLQSDGTRQNLWAKWYDGGWATSNKIDTEDLGDVSAPVVVNNGVGNAVVAWSQHDGSRWNLWSAQYVAAWSPAVKLENEDLGDVSSLHMVAESGGNVMAVWTQSNGTVTNVWAKRLVSGVWSAETKIETDDSGNAGSAQLVIDGVDNITVAWTQSDGSVDSLWANRFSSGSWGSAAEIETLDGDVRAPVLIVDSANRVMVAWSQFDGSRYDLWFNLYSAGSWGAAARVGALDSGSVVDPRFALDGDDRVIAVWQQSYNSRNHLLVSFYAPDSGWGAVGQVDPDDKDSGFAATLLVDSLNNVFVLWQQPDNQAQASSRMDLWANRF